MRVLAYLNISNIDDIESDSGYIFNSLLANSFERIGVEYYMIIPKLLEGKALRFNLEKCFYVDMGVTKYEARYRFDWSNVEKIIHETKPDIVFNNQVELSSAFRALLDKNNVEAKLFTYCHYPAIHIDDFPRLISYPSACNSLRSSSKSAGFCSRHFRISSRIISLKLTRSGYLVRLCLSLGFTFGMMDKPCSRQIISLSLCRAIPENQKSLNFRSHSRLVELKMI